MQITQRDARSDEEARYPFREFARENDAGLFVVEVKKRRCDQSLISSGYARVWGATLTATFKSGTQQDPGLRGDSWIASMSPKTGKAPHFFRGVYLNSQAKQFDLWRVCAAPTSNTYAITGDASH